jgi:DHA1 family inner membrane transport protein
MNKEKLLLLLLACVQFTHIVDFMIIMPLGDTLMKAFSIKPNQFSYIVSSYTFSAGLVGLVGAFFIDKFDRKRILIFAYTGFILGTFACALAPGYHFLLLARILTGAFGGILGALILSIIGDVIPLERRASAMGVVMAAFSAAAVLGVPSGYYIASKFTWHTPFYFLAALSVIILLGIAYLMPALTGHLSGEFPRKSPLKNIISIFKDGNQTKALLLMMLLMLGQFTVIPFIAPYMERNVGFEKDQVTYIYLVGGFLTIFSSPVVGKLADKFGRFKVFAFFATFAAFPLFAMTNMPKTPIGIALVATSLFFIVVGGRMIPATTMITAVVAPQNRGSFMSMNSAVQQISSGFSAFIAGLIVIEQAPGMPFENYQYVGYIAITANLLAIWVASKLKVYQAS